MKQKSDNKKYIIVTVVAVIALLIAIGATSYAVFTATFTGVKVKGAGDIGMPNTIGSTTVPRSQRL